MDCIRCGYKNDEGLKFCTNCGLPLEYETTQIRQQRWQITLVVVASLLVIIVILGTYLVLSRSGHEDTVGNGNPTADSTQALIDASDGSIRGSTAKHVVTFVGNSADSGTMLSVSLTEGENFTIPQCQYGRNGYEFSGWKDENSTVFQPGQVIRIGRDTTLTAQWVASSDSILDSRAVAVATTNKMDNDEGSVENVESSGLLSSDDLERGGEIEKGEGVDKTQEGVATPLNEFKRRWVGQYSGFSETTEDGTIERTVVMDFFEVNEDGTLNGVCYVSVPEDEEGESVSSYYVTGAVDWQTGIVELHGTDWIDQGGLMGVGSYYGTIDLTTGSIEGEWRDPEGEAQPGEWSMWAD